MNFHDIASRLSPHMVVGLEGAELASAEKNVLSRYPPAGVILFARNAVDPRQLGRLTEEISRTIRGASGMIPLIMADHEGGRASALAKAIGTPPSQMAAWAGGDPSVLAGVFRETARRMRSCGVNMTLSPVADVNSECLNPIIGTRAFGETASEVSPAVRAAVTALHEEGILCCIKHFPGHGSSRGDSHLLLPALGKTLDALRETDFLPFAEGMLAGADAVMTAHVAPADRGIPSSLDPKIVRDILRGELNFGGVVMTDGLEMAGILTGRGLKGAAAGASAAGTLKPADGPLIRPAAVSRSAIEAGNDLLLFSRPAAKVYHELEAVLPLLEGDDGFWEGPFREISAVSLKRIVALRKRLESLPPAGSPAGDKAYLDAAGSAVRVERDPGRRLPLAPGGFYPVFFGEEKDFSYYPVRCFMAELMEKAGFPCDLAYKAACEDPEPMGEASISGSPERIRVYGISPRGKAPVEKGTLVLLFRRPIQAQDLIRLSEEREVVIAAERPWDTKLLPPDKTVVTTFGTYDGAAAPAVFSVARQTG